MTPVKRKLLGRNAGVMLRETVYETAEPLTAVLLSSSSTLHDEPVGTDCR